MATTIGDLLEELEEWLEKARDLTAEGNFVMNKSEPVADEALAKLGNEPPLQFEPGELALSDVGAYAMSSYSLANSAYNRWQQPNPDEYLVRLDLKLLLWILPDYRAALEEADNGK